MNIDLVVFDVAGTTVRDDDAVNRCLRDALARHVVVTREEVNSVMGLPKPIAIQVLLDRAGSARPLEPGVVTEVHNDFVQSMVRHYQSAPGIEPMPATLETFWQLKEAGLKLALDTGFSRPILNAVLERLGWNEGGLLDATVASDEVERGRPHADLLLKAMSLTGLSNPQAVAKVGDTPSDLQEGHAAGCGLVIGVTNGTHTREQLLSHFHTHLIGSLKELPEILLAIHPAKRLPKRA
jgi:phosphonatase-like hydrolase